MMNKSIKRAAVLCMAALTLFTSTPYTNVAKAANVTPLHTTVTSTGKADSQKITYKLTLDKTTVSDGRVAVEYDPNVLVLKSDSEGIKFSDVDVNKNYENDKAKGIAYAFVNDAPKTAAGTLMTVQFTVKAGLKVQDTTIKTKVLGLNNEATDVVAAQDLEDVVSVGRAALSTPKITSLDQTILSGGRTGSWGWHHPTGGWRQSWSLWLQGPGGPGVGVNPLVARAQGALNCAAPLPSE